MNPATQKRIFADFASARQRKPVACPTAAPILLDVRAYTDSTRHTHELHSVIKRSWLPLLRESDIPNPGDYATTSIAGVPCIIIRNAQARVEAFVNVCPHRGAVIVRSQRGNAVSLRCPYHGNTYDLHGRLVNAFDHDRPAEPALRPIRSATWGGWCWLNTDRDAMPIEEFLGCALQEELGHWDFEHVEVKDRREYVCDFNWKIGVETFLEALHVAHIHSRTVHPVVDSQVASIAYLGDHSRMAIPFRTPLAFADDGPIGRVASASGVHAFARLNEVQRSANFSYLLFPSTVINLLPNHFTLYRMLPLTAATTQVTYELYGAKAVTSAQTEYYDSLKAIYLQILNEDLANLPWIHNGLASGALEHMTLTAQEERIRAFHAAVLRRIHMGSTSSANQTGGADALT